MTSKEHIESLRRHGVRLIGWDGTTKEIPADFLETTTKMLNDIHPGLSFPDYIKGLRIAHALDLIKEHPDLTVQQIADQSGFYSISSFERSFKSITGKTPREYLKS